jgi:Penicillin amidase
MSRHVATSTLAVAILLVLASSAGAGAQQPDKVLELDAATLAARTEAARSLVPLLQDVKRRAESRVTVQPGGATADSPFAGTNTTLFAVTVGQKSTPVDPQVVQAMDRLLKWQPGDRTVPEAALFDEWLNQLSRKASALTLQTSATACDTECVVSTMTKLNETWGDSPRQRTDLRDQALLEALTDAVRGKK